MKALSGLIIIGWLILPTTIKAQTVNVINILNKVNHAVLKLDQGQFTFHDRLSRRVTDEDSSHSEHTTRCFFRKAPNDSVMGYQLASFREDNYQQIYDGTNLFTVFDQTLEVTGKQAYSGRIKEQFEGFTGPIYLINTNRVLQHFNQPSAAQPIHLLALDNFLGEKCYKLMIDNSRDSLRTSKSVLGN